MDRVGGTAAAVPAVEKGDGCRRGGRHSGSRPGGGEGRRQGGSMRTTLIIPGYCMYCRSKGSVGT